VDYLRRMAVMPESILADPALFAVFEPGIRADFEVLEAEPYVPGAPLDVPVTALGSRGDASVPLGDLADWSGHTAGDFALRLFAGGGHAFFTSATRRLARAITAELLPDGPER
jgi:surfactin synthase thioesterase subunit